jgi:hypothetical protein
MGKQHLIGEGKNCLIPANQPDENYQAARRKNSASAHSKRTSSQPKKGQLLTQHTGLPPRQQKAKTAGKPAKKGGQAGRKPSAGKSSRTR